MKNFIKLMRINRPIGILLLLWPTLWALWFASHGLPRTKFLIIFTLGTIVMRSAGCIINDIADRRIDKHVARTKDRPLTTGEISTQHALILFFALCAIALGLVLLLNPLAQLIAIGALMLAIIYPFSKRFMPIPQLFLGLAFASSVPMAFAAVLNELPKECWVLTAIAVLWPIAYDTEYAMVDRADDVKIGVKSSAIFFGKHDRLAIAVLQIFVLLLLGYLGYYFVLGILFNCALCIAAGLFAYQHQLLREREPLACFKAFLNNNSVGFIIFVGIALSFMRHLL